MTIPNMEVIIMMGDWYAEVGADAYPTWQDTTDKSGLGSSNDRGKIYKVKLVKCDKFNYLELPNTFHAST